MWPFFWFPNGFRSSRSTADLLTVVSDRILRPFNRSGATRSVLRVWYDCLLYKHKARRISGQIFSFISSFFSNRQLMVVLNGKSSKEYPVHAGVPQGPFFVLHISYYRLMTLLMLLSVYNIVIYADDTTGAGSGLLISMLEKLNYFC